MSDAERDAVWNDSFSKSLGGFDEKMAKEQVVLNDARTAAGSGSRSGGSRNEGGGGGGGGGAGGAPGESGNTGNGGGAGGPGGSKGDHENGPVAGIGGGGAPAPRYPAPDGTPAGTDDDVVAKQLREAAETEKDPQLRAKLWEEYRKYKGRKS
jgi:hypothetical protein